MSLSPNSGGPDHALLPNAFPDPDALFQALLTEVSWETMMHRGGPVPRLIAVQGSVSPTGTFPLYRHPADSLPPVLPFTPTVSAILDVVKDRVPVPEGGEINHVLIQHYRGGADYISEHSDKTLDVLRGSTIVNVSLGAERTMTLRPKKEWVQAATASGGEPGEIPAVERIPLPHGSLFLLGPNSNKLYQHGIKHDNRPFHIKSPVEQAFDGERISLTFRSISTFLQPSPSHGPDRFLIYGQGSKVKDVESAQLVPLPLAQITDDEEKAGAQKEAERLLRSFGEENFRAHSFDWDHWYGDGFDIVHLS